MDYLDCGKYRLVLDQPLIMGIVNLTRDSFSGDGVGSDIQAAIDLAQAQLHAGAEILDIGAESTRPGAKPLEEQEELRLLEPVLKEVCSWGVPISVDTYKPAVMRMALEQGAAMINDISGMTNPDALAAVASSDCAVCVMHMQGKPQSMQLAPAYGDVLEEVGEWLADAIARCERAGIARTRILLDPGFGFGKAVEHNQMLFRDLGKLSMQGLPLLVGVSRKSMLGTITARPVSERMPASIAAAMLAVAKGAHIVRVHDVAETRDALLILKALQ